MSRTVLITADSPIGRHASTRVLNRYLNGTQLVVTDAPVPEAGESSEIAVPSGLRVDAPAALVEDARLSVRADESSGGRPRRATAASDELSAYVEFIGPPDPRWVAAIRELGIRVLSYQPENSYLCQAAPAAFDHALTEVVTSTGDPAIRDVVELTSQLKRRLDIISEDGSDVVIVATATTATRAQVTAGIAAIDGVQLLQGDGNDVLDDNRFRLRARVSADAHAALLKLPFVLSIEPFHAPRAEDEVAGLIVAGLVDRAYQPAGSYRAWLDQHAVDGRGVTIGIVDGGVDVDHPAFTGRARDLIGGQKDWHATMVAGHAAGNYLDETDANGFIYGLGTAPAAHILSQDKMQSATFLCRQTVLEAKGPAVQNNSWGKETRTPMDYGSEEALYDALVRNADPDGALPMPLTICFSSGNSGAQGLTRPKSAKNVIVTGNSESFRPTVGKDGSDDIREVYSGPHASSHGNCGDGRIRPHIVAPGEWTASANYDCRPGEKEFISPKLTWGGGSSSASPKTAGACALLTQWWQRNHGGANPSPAMLRALIVNGAEPIVTGGAIPNNRQGWGRLHIGNVTDPAISRVLIDQTTFLTQPGETREWTIRAVDPMQPVKITLAWTDPPGPIGSGGNAASSTIVNKLALRAVAGDSTFRGVHDRFRNGVSVSDDVISPTAGTTLLPEGFDNLQNIVLPPSAISGPVKVSVTALNVTTNCLTKQFDEPKQDFALAIANATFDTKDGSPSVVVAIDDSAGASAPSNDHHDASPDEPQSTEDEQAWWAQGGTNPSRPESAPRSTLAAMKDAEFLRSVKSGVTALLSNKRPASVGDATAESERAAGSSTPRLRDAIAEVKTRFEHCDKEGSVDGCCGVVVVGSSSRASDADIDDLRSLAGRGVIYLVSDAADVLNSLADRIGERKNIRYRLAATPAELAEVARDAICEAGGLQRMILVASRATNGTSAWTYSFDVVPDDRTITVQVRFGGKPQNVTLSRTGATTLTWSAEGPARGQPHFTTTFEDGVLHIRHLRANAVPGKWSLKVMGEEDDPAPQVTVWALGGPDISVREGVSLAENGGDAAQRLVKIAAGRDAQLLEATLVPVTGSKSGNDATLVVRPTPSRVDRRGGRNGPPLAVPELSEIVKMPSDAGTVVVDLAIDVVGTAADKYRFARRLNTNLLRVASRSSSSRGTKRLGDDMLRINGQVTEVKLEKGLVATLRLTQGANSRTVRVATPELGRTLAALHDNSLRGRTFTFSVEGDVLHSMFRSVNGAAARPPDSESTRSTDDRGIEGPIKEVARPRSEAADTDYPLATRFVRAASFSPRPNGRTINRVVIHITDGGARIDGPISWFQNPESRVSAHYIVGQDGEVVQMVHDQDIAWHANGANGDSIGIEHCARAPRPQGDSGLFPTPVQYEASAALVSWLCDQYGIPVDRDHVLGHAEADTRTTHTACPNSVWDWDYYMEIIGSSSSVDPFSETQRAGSMPKRSERKDNSRVNYQYQ